MAPAQGDRVKLLQDILERLKNATRADSELGADILIAVHPAFRNMSQTEVLGCFSVGTLVDPTSSIPACLGLIQGVLPGWDVSLRTGGAYYHCEIKGESFVAENCYTPCIAFLIALISAKLAQEHDHVSA